MSILRFSQGEGTSIRQSKDTRRSLNQVDFITNKGSHPDEPRDPYYIQEESALVDERHEAAIPVLI